MTRVPGRPSRVLATLTALLLASWAAAGCSELLDPDRSPRQRAPAFSLDPGEQGTPLGNLGGVQSVAFGINNVGVIVGRAEPATGSNRPFRWTLGSGMEDITGQSGAAYDVNDAGLIVGHVGSFQAFRWSDSGGLEILPNLIQGGSSQAFAVNANGTIVGVSETTGFHTHAVVWVGSAAPVDLGTLGGTYSEAQDINTSGTIVGLSENGSGAVRAVTWAGAGAVELATPFSGTSVANAVNDSGVVVGGATGSDGQLHAAIWLPDGTMIDMSAPGEVRSQAHDIDNLGRIVGTVNFGTGDQTFFWEDSTRTIVPGTATAIGDNGMISGYTANAGGFSIAVYWNADASQQFTVQCSDTTDIIRADSISCFVSAPSGSLFVQEWKFAAPGIEIADTINETEWEGQLVIGGDITVTALLDSVTHTDTLAVTVQPRDWSAKQIPFPLSELPDTVSDLAADTALPPMPKKPADLGRFRATMRLEGQHLIPIVGGPNHGLRYVDDIPASFAGYVIINDALSMGSEWWRTHTSAGVSSNIVRGPRECSRSDLTGHIRDEVMEHEGLPINPNSHSGLFKTALDSLFLPQLVEQAAGKGDSVVAVVFGHMSSVFDQAFKHSAKADTLFPAPINCTPSWAK